MRKLSIIILTCCLALSFFACQRFVGSELKDLRGKEEQLEKELEVEDPFTKKLKISMDLLTSLYFLKNNLDSIYYNICKYCNYTKYCFLYIMWWLGLASPSVSATAALPLPKKSLPWMILSFCNTVKNGIIFVSWELVNIIFLRAEVFDYIPNSLKGFYISLMNLISD